ncbi:MAG TPA: hypothetical protein VJ695_06930 [Nitrososphaera sp.]|nr:hypothetical protein [Nitrososphaera sp.]
MLVNDDVKARVFIFTFFPGLVLIFVTMVTLNIWAMISGTLLFGVGVGLMTWELGADGSKHGRHTRGSGNDYYSDDSGFRVSSGGSANSKRNMQRGHWYSRRGKG